MLINKVDLSLLGTHSFGPGFPVPANMLNTISLPTLFVISICISKKKRGFRKILRSFGPL